MGSSSSLPAASIARSGCRSRPTAAVDQNSSRTYLQKIEIVVEQRELAATERDRCGRQRVDVRMMRIKREGGQQRHGEREKPEEEAERHVAMRERARKERTLTPNR